jgi:serine protease inhibitor ecotin
MQYKIYSWNYEADRSKPERESLLRLKNLFSDWLSVRVKIHNLNTVEEKQLRYWSYLSKRIDPVLNKPIVYVRIPEAFYRELETFTKLLGIEIGQVYVSDLKVLSAVQHSVEVKRMLNIKQGKFSSGDVVISLQDGEYFTRYFTPQDYEKTSKGVVRLPDRWYPEAIYVRCIVHKDSQYVVQKYDELTKTILICDDNNQLFLCPAKLFKKSGIYDI